MFKAPTLPPTKETSCNKSIFDLSLKRYENKDIDVLGDVGESKRKTFFKKFVFNHQYIEQLLSISLLVYKQKRPVAYVLQNGCS